VDGGIDCERADARLGGVVSTSKEDRVDRHGNGSVLGKASVKAGPGLSDIETAWVFQVGAVLEVAGIFGRLAIDDAGEVRGDDVVGRCSFKIVVEHVLHRPGKVLEADGVFLHFLGVGPGDGLVVGEKSAFVASSGRWKRRYSQFLANLSEGFTMSGWSPSTWFAGMTVDAVMSSSV